MRRLFLTILLLCSLSQFSSAQHHDTSRGMERSRGELTPAPVAALHPESKNSYLREVVWEGGDGHFTANCNIPFAWANRQILLRIASAPGPFRLEVNGKEAGYASSGAFVGEFNLTRQLKEGRNRLDLYLLKENPALRLEDFAHPELPGATCLVSQPTIRLRDILIETRRNQEGDYLAEIALVVKSDALNEKQARIHYELISPAGKHLRRGSDEVRLRMRGEDTLRLVVTIPRSELWEMERPTHYRLKLSTQTTGRHTEYFDLPIAFRHLEQRKKEIYINGEPLQLKPYRVDRPLGPSEIEEIKHTLGCNLLYPAPGFANEELYRLCDEMGIYCVAQSPLCTASSGTSRRKGGNPSNDPAFRSIITERAERTLQIAARHPSVIAVSLGEESANGIGLYEAYLLLKQLEPQRPIIYLDAAGEWNSDPWPAKR